MNEERERLAVRACSHHRFSIGNLTIHPELVGATHTFEHCKSRVHISMPSLISNVQTRYENRQQIYVGSYWVGEEDKPYYYLVGLVHVRVEASEDLCIPATALDHPPNRFELFTDNEQAHLQKVLTDLSEVGIDAYARWLRVLRWKSGVASIGESQLVRHSQETTPVLECIATHRRCWLPGQVLVVPRSEMISCEQWAQAQEALDGQIEPPLWLEFWFDGEHRIRNGDLTGAVLSLAIAFETAVRRLLSCHALGKAAENIVNDVMDNSNMGFILNRLTSLSFWDNDWDRHFDFAKLHSLIRRRNDIMHLAKTKGLTEDELKGYSRDVKAVVYKISRFMGAV